MAAPLSRLSRVSWNLLRKNEFLYTRLLAVTPPDRFEKVETADRIKRFSTHRQKSRIFETIVKDFLTYTVLISGFGYILYKYKNDLHERFSRLVAPILPVVEAKSLTSNINRDRYNFIADVVEVSAPSVVFIEITDSKRFDLFAGKPLTTSNGSGFIVGHDGLILTNAHVVINKPNTQVKVRLHDGTTYTGIVEDIDMQSDLATVRINKTNLPVMKLGSSANIRPGEFVVAIGSPLALSNTITSGVVSSVNRQSEELGLYNKQMEYIQTDAAITFGNSGGPLVNLNGEAIGINAMKVTAGISFAIPIDYAKDFLKRTELRKAGKGAKNVLIEPRRRYIGVTMLSITPDILFEMQQKKGVPHFVKSGVLVYKIIAGSPAHAGGLRVGDIITQINDEPVIGTHSIYKMLEKVGPMILTIVRGYEVIHLKIEPEEV